MYVTDSSSSEDDVSLSKEMELPPPPTKRRRVLRKEQLDCSESEGDAKTDPSSSSDLSCDSSSELEEDVRVVKEKKSGAG